MKLTTFIIARDEENRISKSLESVKDLGEIVVVIDERTTDKTADAARQFTPNVFIHPWEGFVRAKMFALSQITTDWVLWLDADETVTAQFKEDLKKISGGDIHSAFYTPIHSYFMDKYIKSWSRPQDKHVRLFRKSKVRFNESLVHERLIIEGGIGKIGGWINHYPVQSISQHLDKIDRYSTLAAEQMRRNQVEFHFWQLIYYPVLNFLKAFIWRGGWRDGWRGFILNVLYGYNTFLDYLKLWELQKK